MIDSLIRLWNSIPDWKKPKLNISPRTKRVAMICIAFLTPAVKMFNLINSL